MLDVHSVNLLTRDFDYSLPEDLIARHPPPHCEDGCARRKRTGMRIIDHRCKDPAPTLNMFVPKTKDLHDLILTPTGRWRQPLPQNVDCEDLTPTLAIALCGLQQLFLSRREEDDPDFEL
jgi:hypothetical protein